ncbi:hypothetical protein [Kitasatospora sp. NPDC059673]|uniref:hypothetical protein n=1 Tax=Kitasatospora sp. NPDC059673 TaxID=3346901 RepID=UPI0036B6E25C
MAIRDRRRIDPDTLKLRPDSEERPAKITDQQGTGGPASALLGDHLFGATGAQGGATSIRAHHHRGRRLSNGAGPQRERRAGGQNAQVWTELFNCLAVVGRPARPSDGLGAATRPRST